jgi:hypothetical protein
MVADWLGEGYTRDDRGYRDQNRVPGMARGEVA